MYYLYGNKCLWCIKIYCYIFGFPQYNIINNAYEKIYRQENDLKHLTNIIYKYLCNNP